MDREFIADIERDQRGAALVASVIELGRTPRHGRRRRGRGDAGPAAPRCAGMGCAFLQGWLLGRPVDRAELTRALVDGFDPAVLDAVRHVRQLDTGVHTVGRAG